MTRSRRTAVAAAAAIGALVGSLDAQCPDGTPPPCEVRAAQVAQRRVQAPPLNERGRSFLVLPFRNVTRSADHDWLVEGATTLLSDALGQWEEISVVSAERLYPALRRHDLEPGQVMDEDGVRRVAEETGGWTAVTGDVLVTGSRIRLSARAYDVVSNEVVVRATENADGEEDILPAFERLAGQLLATAGLEADEADLAGMNTQSLDAYRAYIRGMGHFHRNEMHQARDAFQEAVDLDSTFAQAHLKLAESLMTTFEAIADPQSAAYRHAERAAALSQRLPPRDREFVQALAALFRGQIGAARAGLERVLATDSNDLEALENLAELEVLDPILVQTPDGEFPRGSLNEGARLAKRALALDPGRHQNFETLTGIYLTAAGEMEGRVMGIRSEPPSLLQLFQQMAQRPARVYVAVLRDTIELVPVDSLDVLGSDSLHAARQRAASAAAAWASQWVAATPDAAMANLAASQAHAHAGQYDAALRYLATADSVGVELEMLQNLQGRRVQILVRGRRHTEAAELVDSMMDSGYLESATDNAALGFRLQDLGWCFQAYLLDGRVGGADSLASYLWAFFERVTGGAATEMQLMQEVLVRLAMRTDASSFVALPAIPERIRFAAADSLLAHVDMLPEGGLLNRDLGILLMLTLVDADPPVALQRAVEWRRHAERRVAEGDTLTVFGLVMPSVELDTTAAGRQETYELLRAITNRAPELWEAHYQLGKLGAVSGMYLDDAEAALRHYLEHEPSGTDPETYRALARLGLVLEHKGDVEGARASYEEALRQNPQEAEARAGLERLGGGG